MARVDGRKASAHRISNVREHNEPLTCRSAPHPSTKKHHEETIVPYAIIDFVDYSSVEHSFYENRLLPERYERQRTLLAVETQFTTSQEY